MPEVREVARRDALVDFETLVQRLAEALTLRRTIDVLVEEARRMTAARVSRILLASADATLSTAELSGLPPDAVAVAQGAIASRARRDGGSWSALPLVVRNRAIGVMLLEAPAAEPA